MSRLIDLNDYPLRHQPVINWLRGNGLNPARIPKDQVVEVGHGRLWVKQFVLNEDGNKIISGNGVVTETTSVSLISAPETHGL